eukprot:GFKZ01002924.1.p1 GENE.GFKZ01002924.1~~GFKZ01002924.1.p1  ORF type:complete len:246 (-),score=19.78 GFKZ01002924.1:593-1330(-)
MAAFIGSPPLVITYSPCSPRTSLRRTLLSPSHLRPRPVYSPARLTKSCASSPSPPPTDEKTLPDVHHQFLVSIIGAYFALQEISPADAVPESVIETFKSKPASLTHPIAMWLIFGTVLYTFYLGFQSRRIRSAEPEQRKELVKGKFGQRHLQTSSALFAVMTLATFEGMANTYTRTGKLFPGPHLYAGLGLVALMSVMSAVVPYMQKGKDWARGAHFGMAFLCVGLFGWQAKSGMVIVGKLLGWK